MAPAPKYSPQQQEEIILSAAVDCINESSLLDFTMSAVSKKAGLSMGSIYKLVQCKEDIIFALATHVFKHQCSIFRQVMAMELTTPEKMIALMLLSSTKNQVYPFDSHLECFSTNELVISRASELWTDRMIRSHEQCKHTFDQCMNNAAATGELAITENLEQIIEEINLGCWALAVGSESVKRVIQLKNISDGTDSVNAPIVTDDFMVKSLQRLLNSYPWKKSLDAAGIEKAAAELVKQGLR